MKWICLLLAALMLAGCAAGAPGEVSPSLPQAMDETAASTLPSQTESPDPIRQLLDSMTLEQRVGQLFLARCDAATALYFAF